MKCVILAGGKGRRLQPFTTTIPKPLFPLGEKPILQIIIEQLKTYHITDFVISLGYLGGLIEAFFGDGSKFNCDIQYVIESEPLGTAGAISLLPEMGEDFVFMNGDILTTLDFNKAIQFHKHNSDLMTICTFKKKVISSLGVLEINNANDIISYLEKPVNEYLVSSGIYILSPKIKDFVYKNETIDLPQLVLRLIENKKRVKSFLIEGDWFDIGTPGDLELALKYFEGKNK